MQGDRAGIVLDVCQRPAVHVLGQLFGVRIDRVGVVPGQVEDRIGEGAALLAVHLPDAVEDSRHDPDVGLRFARRIGRLPVPLHPAGRIDQGAGLLGKAGHRQLEDFGLDLGGFGGVLRAEILPEPRGLRVQGIHHDEELQLAQGAAGLAPVREGLQRIEALADIAVHLAGVHHVEGADDVVAYAFDLRQPVVGPVIVDAGCVAIDRLLETDEELPIVLQIADLAGAQRLVLPRRHVLLECGLAVFWQHQVARHRVRQQADVGKPLDVGMAAQSIHAAARHPDIAEQQLDHRHGADVLGPDRVLGPAEGEHAGHRLVGRRRAGEERANLQVLVLRRAADIRHHLRRIAFDVLAQQVDHAAGVLPGVVDLRVALAVQLIVPGRLVVAVSVFLVAGEQPVLESEAVLHDQAGVGVGPHVVVLDEVLLKQIADHAVQEGDVGAGPDRRINIGDRRRAGEAWVHHDQLGVVLDLGFNDPLEPAGMGFGGVAAHDQNHIGILDVLPSVGHCASTECWSQTGHRRSVSDTRLIVEDEHPE